MSIKYKIDDAKKNKNLIDDKIKLSRVKSKGGMNGDRTPPKKQKSTKELLIEFMSKQRKFNKSIREDLNKVIKLNNLKH